MTPQNLPEYDELKELFFGVVAKRVSERMPELDKYNFVPYLNSSLFEPTEELSIAELKDNVQISIYKGSVLKRKGYMNPLEYLLLFLDAYDFGATESENGLRKENKTLINASVLGLIFEQINGYKDGSFYTPGNITQYMCKEALQRAVIQKFNDKKGWNCQTLTDVGNQCIMEKVSIKEKNDIINSIRICDPGVGSGHFLVSALNEIINIKNQLFALCDANGSLFNGDLSVANDELYVTDANGDVFTYNPKVSTSQTIQEILFNEKRTIIENCLFGVDINPNSVNICRLRLWIELLKNAYYHPDGTLETLPNIDINIKCGNSLVSYYPVEIGQVVCGKGNLSKEIKEYKEKVRKYKQENDKEEKQKVKTAIAQIKRKIAPDIQLQLELDDSFAAQNREALDKHIYHNSMEWMIEFPEVLDNDGHFQGFDVVIGNPPYFNIQTLGAKSQYAEFVKNAYNDIWQDKSDILFYFFRLAMKLAKGTICFITSNAYLFSDKAQKLRKKMIEEKRLHKIINFEEYMVFPKVSITTCITLMTNDNSVFYAVNMKGKEHTSEEVIGYIDDPANTFKVNLSANAVFALVNSRIADLNAIIDGKHETLDKLVKMGKGMETAADPVFLFDTYPSQFPADFIKKRVTGSNMDKFVILPKDVYILYFEEINEFEDLPPAIQNHLNAHKSELSNRATVKNEGKKWWKYSRPMHRELYDLPKLFCSRRNFNNKFCYDDSCDYIGFSNMTVIFDTEKKYPIKYILALLNSKTLNFRYKSIGKQTGGGSFEYFPNEVGKLPIPFATPAQQQPIIDLVDQILVAKKANPPQDTSALEQQIDLLVYRLYGLSYDDVLTIDPNTAITKAEYENV